MSHFFAPERYVTERFVIRRYQPGDGRALARATNVSYEHLIRFLPWARPHQSYEQAEQTIRQFSAHWLQNTDYVAGVWDRDEERLLGGTGFHLREGDITSGNGEIGMWIAAPEAGQGLGTAVAEAMLAWGFGGGWPFERLIWVARADNHASQRVAEKAGMVFEGRRRSALKRADGQRLDALVYSMLKDEWRAR